MCVWGWLVVEEGGGGVAGAIAFCWPCKAKRRVAEPAAG